MGGPLPRRRTETGAPDMTVPRNRVGVPPVHGGVPPVVADIRTLRVAELRLLEAEAVHIIREVVAELARPVLLFSAGKDSIVLLRLGGEGFRPRPLPFPVLHVHTGHNFPVGGEV